MAAGFEMRDSVVTASVYDDAYQGSSTDNTDPGSATLTFSKADEVAVVTHMQESRSITLVDVDLSSPSTWVRSSYASDSLGWATLYLSG